jgi:acetyltransferase-like isoleucine patch superfamily enzyme
MINKLLRFIVNNIINFIKYFPFNWSMSLRSKCYKYILKNVGDSLNIGDGVTINEPYNISIGSRVSIHPNCWIQGYGGVSIGSYIGIASGTKIISSIHNFSSIDIPIKNQGITKEPVVIEDDVWIGANAIIHGNTIIGHGSIISAGASVSGKIEPYSIIAGNPGRLIKKRIK